MRVLAKANLFAIRAQISSNVNASERGTETTTRRNESLITEEEKKGTSQKIYKRVEADIESVLRRFLMIQSNYIHIFY